MQIRPYLNEDILKRIPQFRAISGLSTAYNPDYPYGNLYSSFIELMENELTCIESGLSDYSVSIYDDLVRAVYHNDNRILENHRVVRSTKGHNIYDSLLDTGLNVNGVTPHTSCTVTSQVRHIYPEFNPQQQTNIPSLKNFLYKREADPIEYRFSTQAQRHRGQVRISPLFKRWLNLVAAKTDSNQKISFVYFNNLNSNRNLPNIGGYLESQLTKELSDLEAITPLKIAVITLPASGGLMDILHYTRTEKIQTKDLVYKDFLNIALGEESSDRITDFYISPRTRSIVFSGESQERILRGLLDKSFAAMGIIENDPLSLAQIQAVWFHFIKYNLTHYLLIRMQPKGFNFSCKEAIDRGAISSAYYNLMQSMTTNCPLSQIEFESALHAAAANTRGRGLNSHKEGLWNAIDYYVNANYEMLLENTKIAWLIYWRDENCPKARLTDLIETRIKQCRMQLTRLSPSNPSLSSTVQAILSEISAQHSLTHHSLLLELLSLTSKLLANPNKQDIETYQRHAQELALHQPGFEILSGLMLAMLGCLLYLPSLSYSNACINRGLERAKLGFFAANSKHLIQDMQLLSTHFESILLAQTANLQ